MPLGVRKLNFTKESSIKRGMDITIPLRIRSNGAVVPLNNYSTAVCRIRQYYDSVTNVYIPEVLFADKDQGLINLVFVGDETKDLKAGTYLYDIFFLTGDNKSVCFVEGDFEFAG